MKTVTELMELGCTYIVDKNFDGAYIGIYDTDIILCVEYDHLSFEEKFLFMREDDIEYFMVADVLEEDIPQEFKEYLILNLAKFVDGDIAKGMPF